MLALSRSIQPSLDVRLLEPAPQQLLLAGVATTNGHSNGAVPAAALREEDVGIPEDEAIESLVRPLVESAEPLIEACVEAVAMAVGVEQRPVVEIPEVAAVVELPVEVVAEAAVVEAVQAAPVVEAVASVTEEVPVVEETREVAPVVESPAEVVAEAAVEAVASVTEEVPVVGDMRRDESRLGTQECARHDDPEVVPVEAALPTLEPIYDCGPICRALELHAQAVLHVIQTQLDVFESGIRAIVAGFEARPAAALLAAPREILRAPALPATQWMRTPKPSIPSVRPCELVVSSLSSGPLTSALAGPCLPADLRTLIENKSTKSARPRKRVAMPAWVISLLVATSLFLGAGSLLQYLSENRDAKAAPAAGQHPLQASAGTSTGAAVDPHPFARFVEVTGLRVIADLNHKSQMQYVVVNHSSARLSEVALKIAVRSTADSGSAPLFTLSVVVPSLAPYQSKEIRTDLDAALRLTAIPDWDNLRADVQVSTKQ